MQVEIPQDLQEQLAAFFAESVVGQYKEIIPELIMSDAECVKRGEKGGEVKIAVKATLRKIGSVFSITGGVEFARTPYKFKDESDPVMLDTNQPNLPGIDDATDLPRAKEIIQRDGIANAAHLQRHMRIGFNHACNILIELETLGVIGPVQDDGSREIL